MARSGKRGLRLGFTTLELMVALGVMVMFLILVIESGALATSTLAKVQSTSNATSKNRSGFEQLMADIRAADHTLTQYPSSNPAYFADNATTIILRIPQADVNGDPVSQKWNLVIYKRIATTGDNAPALLKRYTATINGSTESAVIFDKDVMTQVQTFEPTFIMSETLYGQGETTSWNLVGTPIGDGANYKQSVLVNSTERLSTSKAWFTGQTLNFDQGVNWYIPIDVSYQVDPTVAVNPQNGIAANSIQVRVVIKPNWRARSATTMTKNLEFVSQSLMVNR